MPLLSQPQALVMRTWPQCCLPPAHFDKFTFTMIITLGLQAARHQPSLRATFRGLVDLLVAWWLEPRLDDIVRSALIPALLKKEQAALPQLGSAHKLPLVITHPSS